MFDDGGQGVEQQVEAFIGIEGADETDDGFAGQPPFFLQLRVGWVGQVEGVDIDGIGNDGDFAGRNAARQDIGAKAFANGKDMVDLLGWPGFRGCE